MVVVDVDETDVVEVVEVVVVVVVGVIACLIIINSTLTLKILQFSTGVST